MQFKKQFLTDVITGLSKPIKQLSSKYFYDEKGDKLFQQIMQLDEYYLPQSELEILKTRAADMIEGFDYDHFDVVELGAGDGSKTVFFLEKLLALGKQPVYRPLDISPDVLATNKTLMKTQLPSLPVEPIAGDYFETLSEIDKSRPKIILFMGSNIGNYKGAEAKDFLEQVRQHIQPNDLLLVAFDLKKNPKVILNAYNDAQGVTRQFNLNLLERLNRELGANFDLNSFEHYPTYQPLSGITYSFIVSLKKQKVEIQGQEFNFENGEVIHTEVSQKYNLEQIERLKEEAGFSGVRHFLDEKKYYSISVFKK